MNRSLSSHHVHCDSSRRVAAAARGVLAGRALVSEPCNGWVSLWSEDGREDGPEEILRVALELSRRLAVSCVSFLLEPETRSRCWLHDQGELVDHFDSRRAGAPSTPWPGAGDAQAFAGYCLAGTDVDDVQDVFDAEPDFEQDRVEALAELLGIESLRATLCYEAIAEGARSSEELPEDGSEPTGSEEPAIETEPPPPLHAAARRGDGAAVQLLIDEGAEVDGPDGQGRTALHHAAESLTLDYEEMGEGERREWWRRNAQARAAALEREEEASRAWERERREGLDEDSRERGALAARALLEAGADPSARDARGRGPLHAAAREGHAAVLRELLAAGADPDAADDEGRTALHAAAEWGWGGVLAALLEAGASVDPVDSWGWTPLMLAAESGYAEQVEWLLEAGADPRRENDAGRTPAGVAGDAGRSALAARLREL